MLQNLLSFFLGVLCGIGGTTAAIVIYDFILWLGEPVGNGIEFPLSIDTKNPIAADEYDDELEGSPV